jgi:urea transporter
MSTSATGSRGGVSALNGTMPEWSKRTEGMPALDFVDYCLRGVGQVVFQNNPITGLAILVAIWIYSPWVGFAGTLGLVVSTVTGLVLGMDRGAIRAGLYGFNGVLVGLALATFLGPHWNGGVIGYVIAVSAFSTVLMATLAKIFLGTWGVPAFTLPFNFATLIFLVAALQFKFGHLLITPHAPVLAGHAVRTGLRATPTSASVIDASSILNAIFRGIGQLFFADKLISGIIMIVGIAVCSRIAAIFALIGSIFGMLTAFAVGADGNAIYHGLWGFNSFDACLAIGGVFYVLTWRSGLLAVACAIATAILFGAIGSLFAPWGLPALTLPFCFGTLAFVVMKGTSTRFIPVEVADITTPEEHLTRMRGEHSEGVGRDAVREFPEAEPPPREQP